MFVLVTHNKLGDISQAKYFFNKLESIEFDLNKWQTI